MVSSFQQSNDLSLTKKCTLINNKYTIVEWKGVILQRIIANGKGKRLMLSPVCKTNSIVPFISTECREP